MTIIEQTKPHSTHSAGNVALTTAEAAEYLGLTASTLNKWRCFGGGPKFLKLGRAVRYRREDLDAFIDHQTVASTAEYGQPMKGGGRYE